MTVIWRLWWCEKKKMQKKHRHHWQILFLVAMLWALCFAIQGFAAEQDTRTQELRAALAEKQIALQAARQKIQDLQLAVAQSRQQHLECRRKQAEAIAKCNEQIAELADLRMKVAHVLASPANNGDTGECTVKAEALVAQLDYVQTVRTRLTDLKSFLSVALDALDPSKTMRCEIGDRLARLEIAVDRLQRLPPEVAGRGGHDDRVKRKARILTVNDELGIVVIDAGSMNEVQPGSTWRVVDDGKVLVTLKVVVTHEELSAAASVEGSLQRLTPGMIVKHGLEANSEDKN